MGKKLLIVRDDRQLENSSEERLGVFGYQVTVTQSVDDSLVKAKRERPDLIILDMHLPDAPGVYLYERFSQFRVPVLVVSALPRETVAYFLHTPHFLFLPKPFELSELSEYLEWILE